jgi:transglutaminase-like putative cysteine protease
VLRLLGWIIRKLGPRPLSLLAVLLVALASVAYGLAGLTRDLDAGLLLTMVALGALTGWLLATILAPGWLSGMLASSLGVALAAVRVGRLESRLAAVARALLGTMVDIWHWLADGPRLFRGPAPDWMATPQAFVELWSDAAVLLDRGRGWTVALLFGDPLFDPAATALVWSLIVWAVAAWAGWAARHHRPLQSVAPAGALLATVLSYLGAGPTALLVLLGAALLLMALTREDARERRWQAGGIDFSKDIWGDLAMSAALLSLALVVVAALAPSVSVQDVVDFAERLTTQRQDETESVAESLGLEPRSEPERTAFSRTLVTGLPRRRLIGSGAELRRQVVMVIRTGELPPGRPAEEAPRHYWRGATYDRYTGRGWYTSRTEITEYEAGESVVPADVPFHQVLRQDVQVVGSVGQILHAAGTPATVDQDVQVAWRSPADVFGIIVEGDTYRAESLISTFSEQELRSAGTDYPDWVRNRYLYLPDKVPERVLVLARDMTATEPTPYEQARAIESYLRTFPYTLDVPAPPSNRDIADYFLFELQRGYCGYYATSMVVMARAVGLPARLVVGYASGRYDPADARYIVTAADAHAWVEIYFPEYGWVEFEPTAGLPAIVRPTHMLSPRWSAEEGSALLEEPSDAAAERSGAARVWWLGLSGGLASLTLTGILLWEAEIWRLRLLTPVGAATALYRLLRLYGRRLGVPMLDGDTPYEFAAAFGKHAAAAGPEVFSGAVQPAVVEEASDLVDLYVRAVYAPHSPHAADRDRGIRTWRRLRRRLWAARLRRWWWASLPGRVSVMLAGNQPHRG